MHPCRVGSSVGGVIASINLLSFLGDNGGDSSSFFSIRVNWLGF